MTCEQLEEYSSKLGYGQAQPMTYVPLDVLVYRLVFGHSQERKRDIERA